MAKKLILVTDENNCITPSSHKLNKDGYFRKDIGNRTYVMYHRYVWELVNGPIPDGYEINHKCKNRACCNVDHLECISGEEHASLTGAERYAERLILAEIDWRHNAYHAKMLSEKYCVSVSCAYRWIRNWKV